MSPSTFFCHLIIVTSISSWYCVGVVIDGENTDGEYGPALAVQLCNSGFGDSLVPGGTADGGSELDALYTVVENDTLYVLIAGNLQYAPGHTIEVFFHDENLGENTLSGVPAYDVNDEAQNLVGLTFDASFKARYHLFLLEDSGTIFATMVDRAGGTNATVPCSTSSTSLNTTSHVSEMGRISPDQNCSLAGASISHPIDFALNNLNVAGVGPYNSTHPQVANQSAAEAVSTGMEFSISLADIGSLGAGDEVLMFVGLNNGDATFFSNQFLPPLASPSDNLGAPATINFTSLNGTQYSRISIPDGVANSSSPADESSLAPTSGGDGGNNNDDAGDGGGGGGPLGTPEYAGIAAGTVVAAVCAGGILCIIVVAILLGLMAFIVLISMVVRKQMLGKSLANDEDFDLGVI